MTVDRLAELIGLAESRCYTHEHFMELLRAVEEEKAVADGLQKACEQLRRERRELHPEQIVVLDNARERGKIRSCQR